MLVAWQKNGSISRSCLRQDPWRWAHQRACQIATALKQKLLPTQRVPSLSQRNGLVDYLQTCGVSCF